MASKGGGRGTRTMVVAAVLMGALEWQGWPVSMFLRNCLMPPKPAPVSPNYAACSGAMMADEVTIVVTVKDACSQAPGFIDALARFAPPDVHLIYSFPNFRSCAQIDMERSLARWDKVMMMNRSLRMPNRRWYAGGCCANPSRCRAPGHPELSLAATPL